MFPSASRRAGLLVLVAAWAPLPAHAVDLAAGVGVRNAHGEGWIVEGPRAVVRADLGLIAVDLSAFFAPTTAVYGSGDASLAVLVDAATEGEPPYQVANDRFTLQALADFGFGPMERADRLRGGPHLYAGVESRVYNVRDLVVDRSGDSDELVLSDEATTLYGLSALGGGGLAVDVGAHLTFRGMWLARLYLDARPPYVPEGVVPDRTLVIDSMANLDVLWRF